jgi:hypothetical protein
VERIIRRTPTRVEYFGTGESQFDATIAPRLTNVALGKRAVGFTLSSIQRVIQEMIAEGEGTAPNIVEAEISQAPKRIVEGEGDHAPKIAPVRRAVPKPSEQTKRRRALASPVLVVWV